MILMPFVAYYKDIRGGASFLELRGPGRMTADHEGWDVGGGVPFPPGKCSEKLSLLLKMQDPLRALPQTPLGS